MDAKINASNNKTRISLQKNLKILIHSDAFILLFFLFLSAALSAGGVHYHPIFLTSDKALVDRTMQRLHRDIHYFH